MRKSKLMVVLNVLAIIVVVAIAILAFVRYNTKLKTKQEDYKEFEVKEKISLVIPGGTNIRSHHSTGSAEDDVQMVISRDREYDWHLTVSRYYKVEDYRGRTWYGIAADSIAQDNAPKAVRKWCEKHPDLIFWACATGGVTVD